MLDRLMLLWLRLFLGLFGLLLGLILSMNVLVFFEHVDFPLVDIYIYILLIFVFVSKWSTSLKRLLLEFLRGLVVLFDKSCELS